MQGTMTFFTNTNPGFSQAIRQYSNSLSFFTTLSLQLTGKTIHVSFFVTFPRHLIKFGIRNDYSNSVNMVSKEIYCLGHPVIILTVNNVLLMVMLFLLLNLYQRVFLKDQSSGPFCFYSI